MIEKIALLRNVGLFDSVDAGAQLPFSKLTLVHAENGRGKTTLAAILQSLGTGDAGLIASRRRLSAQHPPHIVLNIAGNPPFIFQNGAWSASFPRLAVYDDMFVAQNVCSGIEIAAEHRQNLHELILGARGVTLNARLQTYVAKIEDHNRALRMAADAIPAAARGPLTVEKFCALGANPNIAKDIQNAERSLAAAKAAAAVQQQSTFAVIFLPGFDTVAITALLGRDLPEMDAAAAARVQAHLATLGDKAENWVGDGIPRIAPASVGQDHDVCPFCAQDLRGSPVIDHYRAYFSQGYASLKTAIANATKEINATHGDDIPAAFERAVRVAVQGREFWKTFLDVSEISIDTAAISRTWKSAREAVIAVLRAKQATPLDPITLPADALEAITNYEKSRAAVAAVSDVLQTANVKIGTIKEKAAVANVANLMAGLAKLKAVEARHNPQIIPLCRAYLDEQTAKKVTEGLRDQARADLDRYRQTVFPAYESAINTYTCKNSMRASGLPASVR
ncbi:MAG: AAA family ATPase [Desulfobaccales bacterium]